jgi:tetratricopeptide (TPR) repeat protein
MSLRIKSFAFTALTCLFLSIPAFAQTTGVEGNVKGPDGKPLQNAVVAFDRKDIKGHYTVKTDKKGHYGHYGLPIGTYDISLTVDGKNMGSINNIKTKPGDPMTGMDFDLEKAAKQQEAANAGNAEAIQDATRGMSKDQKEAFDKNQKAREAQLAKNKALNDAYTAGKNAVEAKQWDQAIESLNKAAELDAKQGAVWGTLADAYVGKAQATPAEAAANYDKSFDAFRKAIEISPNDAGLYNNYALALAKDKKLDDAKTNLAKAAELDPPGAGKYYYNLGALLVNSGQNDAAVDTFKKAIESDPNYADAQYQYGVALASKATIDASGKTVPPPGTIEALQKYLELKPDGPNAASAKDMITALGATLDVNFANPNAPKKGAPAPKKK